MKAGNRTIQLSSGAWRFAAVIATTLLAIAVSVYSVSHGQFIIFQNLFYFPIIIACIYYLKRGFIFSVGLAFIYFILIAAYTADFMLIREALIRVAIFIFIAGVVTLISVRRRRVEQELRESNVHYNALADNSLFGVAVMDKDYRIIRVNDTFATMFRKPADEFVGRNCFNEFEKRLDICPHCPGKRAMSSGMTEEVETQGKRDDGTIFYVRNRAIPFFGPDGAINGFIETVEDIDEQKRAQQKLRDSEAQYRNLVESTSDWVWAVDHEGRYTYSSPKIWEILGYRPEELIGKTPFDFMPPEEASKVAGILTGYMTDRKPFSGLVNINLHKDGSLVSLETSAEPIFDEAGDFAGYRGIDRNITERVQAEETIRHISAIQNLILANSTLGIALVRNRTFEWVNARMGELLMLPLDRIQGFSTRVIYPSDEAYEELGRTAYPLLDKGEEHSENILQLRRSNGTLFWCRFIGKAINPANPQDGSIWMLEDVTERKRAEERSNKEMALKNFLIDLYKEASGLDDKELYDYVLEQVVRFTDSSIGFFHIVSDDQTTIELTTWNGEALRICPVASATHYTIDQAGNWVDCIKLKQPVIYNNFSDSPHQKGFPEGHFPIQRFMSVPVIEQGKVRSIFGVGNKSEEYNDDDAVLIQVVANDLQRIIVQRRTEEALSRSEMYFRALIENSADIITILDTDGTIRYESPTVKRVLGYSPSELIGRKVFEFVHPEDLPAVSDAFGSVVQKPGDIISTELRFRYNDGSWRILESVGQNLLENDVVKGIVINSRDITEYNDDSWRILESVGQNLLENGAVKGIVMNSRDITERKKIQAELQKKNLELARAYEDLQRKQAMIIEREKMASIGMLAAGIAHEIKNPLAIILQGIEYLQTEITDDSPMVEVVARLNLAILRADKIVKGLIGYSRQDQLSLSARDIPALIDESLVLMENELRKKNLQVIKQYGPDLPGVSIDVNQIKQVFINVLLNGIEAMSKNGTFTISVQKIEKEKGGNVLRISFKDTGPGIPADRAHKIFDPFYTSKGVSNTGLGLYIARGIIDKHKGIIYAVSPEGQGATMIIELPIA